MTRLIFGTGDYRYEVVQPFGVLPPGMEFGVTSHVGIDSQGRMYVTQRKDPPVLVFDPQGEYLGGGGRTSWPTPTGCSSPLTMSCSWQTGAHTRC